MGFGDGDSSSSSPEAAVRYLAGGMLLGDDLLRGTDLDVSGVTGTGGEGSCSPIRLHDVMWAV